MEKESKMEGWSRIDKGGLIRGGLEPPPQPTPQHSMFVSFAPYVSNTRSIETFEK